MSITIKNAIGTEIIPYLNDLARLRIEVFRDFPYLYEGSFEYETHYLQTYSQTIDSLIVLAFDGEKIVGASTALPLSAETNNVTQPFINQGFNIHEFLYLGESILQKSYRGQGLGVRFFEEREAHARRLNKKYATFCAVERPLEHPRRPADYIPLDNFWQHRGYYKQNQLITTFSWKDLDENTDSPKPMTFWLKKLT
jgi:GNAT superfamily N-acetyltransferase